MGHALRIFTVLLLAGTLVARAEDRKPAATTKPARPLLGRWEVVSIGKKQVPHEFTPIWTIDNEHVTVTDRAGAQISRNAYTIDRSKGPPQLVMKVEGEKDRIGWYRLNDKELQLLLTINTGNPPKSWDDGSIIVLRPVPTE